MRYGRKIIATILALLMCSTSVFAEETITKTFKATTDGENISVVETDLYSDVDNSNLPVKVIRQVGEVSTVIYEGLLGGYDNGIWKNTDFNEIQFMVILDWDSAENESIYIIPIEEDENIEATSTKTEVYQKSIVQSTLNNVRIDVSLLYDNTYNECILKPGEELTAEINAVNSSTSDSSISAIIALYDENSRLITLNTESQSIPANDAGQMSIKTVVPEDSTVATAKLMLWEFSNIKPYTSPLVLTLTGDDFFGDDYNLAQNMGERNLVSGIINDLNDVDIFEFKAMKDGLYTFESYGDTNVSATLSNKLTPTQQIAFDDNSGTDNNFRISTNLQEGESYYLKVTGASIGQYRIVANYVIGNVYGSVSPVKFYDDDTEYNTEIESTVNLRTYHTDEFVATMHLKDWSESSSELAQYSMTGVHAGEYLVETKRPGYLTHYQKVTLDDNIIDLGSIVLVPGDVNSDNVIDSNDISIVTGLSGIRKGEETYLVSADINADKIIDANDIALINANINKDSNYYNTNVNIAFVNTAINDSELTISGKAKPNSTIKCVVTYDGYSFFEEETLCSETGEFELFTELNRSGVYTVNIASDAKALEVTKIIEF